MNNEKILIVEDEKVIALDIQRRLERYGYSVVGMGVPSSRTNFANSSLERRKGARPSGSKRARISTPLCVRHCRLATS